MDTFERILLKLIIVHFVLVVLFQSFSNSIDLLKHINKVHLYEGVAGIQEQESILKVMDHLP